MSDRWFVLYPDTFLWIKKDKGLVYNSSNHAMIVFANCGKSAIIVKTLLNIESLYRVLLTEDILQDPEVYRWINEAVDKKCGNIVFGNTFNNLPVSLKPVLKIQDDVDYYKWMHKQGIDGNIIQNLHHLIFYINGSEFGNELYGKQTVYPEPSGLTLDTEKICRFVMNARASSFLSDISLVGDPLKIPELLETVNKLQNICPVTIYITIQDFVNELSQLKGWLSIVKFNVLVTDYKMLEQLLEAKLYEQVRYTFLITSEDEYEIAIGYIDEYSLEEMNIVPLYTETNLSFFEECLYMNEEELHNIALSKREIFVRQTLNIFNFGTLFVKSDGNVYANINDDYLGTIDESPHSLVYRELTERKSWLGIRDKKPCCDCVYQWLCPSPSNYERVMNKCNLCHINS